MSTLWLAAHFVLHGMYTLTVSFVEMFLLVDNLLHGARAADGNLNPVQKVHHL